MLPLLLSPLFWGSRGKDHPVCSSLSPKFFPLPFSPVTTQTWKRRTFCGAHCTKSNMVGDFCSRRKQRQSLHFLVLAGAGSTSPDSQSLALSPSPAGTHPYHTHTHTHTQSCLWGQGGIPFKKGSLISQSQDPGSSMPGAQKRRN